MCLPEDRKRPESTIKLTGLDKFIDRLTEAWFNNDIQNWSRRRRFMFALAGATTFALAFFAFELPITWSDRLADPLLLRPTEYFA